jgi:adenylosuccinate lyase
VQRNALRAWDEERDFRELVSSDPELSARLAPADLDSVFDLDATLRHLDTVFDRLNALVRKEEPVHA